ncbi:glycerol-3-phosphate phosphatase [Petromyzon marinus]|uniref:Glycerol-3-phosphate phosphatase n=1 Tax=Petromyzon marinus TaxID=7757 RepID=A0AAJ7THS0_PETMA|nr:glycerol-3-phosphate phosphatase [Petromyzon marinus]
MAMSRSLHACERLSVPALRQLLRDTDTLLFDCDGVVWRGADALPGAAATLNALLRTPGKRVFFLTNNSSATRRGHADKLRRLGVRLPGGDEPQRSVYGTAHCAPLFLLQQQQEQQQQEQQEQQQQRPYKVYLIGSEAMASALEEAGIPFVGGPGPEVDLGWPPEKPELDPDVRAVLLGFDRHFSYAKMVRAVAYLRDPACAFVATNTDTCLPLEGDRVIPGTGSLLAALECASQRKAAIVGKPSEFMFECVLRAEKVARERCLMVGDRLDTDILMGTQCGLPTLLVLTGVSTLAEAQACRDSSDHERHQLAPTYVIDSIADLLPAIDEL